MKKISRPENIFQPLLPPPPQKKKKKSNGHSLMNRTIRHRFFCAQKFSFTIPAVSHRVGDAYVAFYSANGFHEVSRRKHLYFDVRVQFLKWCTHTSFEKRTNLTNFDLCYTMRENIKRRKCNFRSYCVSNGQVMQHFR